jgi:hypothetical protein
MRLLRAFLTVLLLATGWAALPVLTAPAAHAHTHPTPVELDSPAVVRVQTYAEVSISLIEHNKIGAHIGLLQRTYTPLLSSGSGFAVDPSGAVVTSHEAIDVDLRPAEVYAVNRIFNEHYGDARAPLPRDPSTRQTIRDSDPNDRLNMRLQRCYRPNTTDDSGGCVVFSRRVVKVLPFVLSQRQFGDLTAEVLVPKDGKAQDVAVLKVGGSSMPTVNLATSTEGVAAFSILGFTEVPRDGRSLRTTEGHFVRAAAAEVKRDEQYASLSSGIRAGMVGGPAVGERGQVVGFLRDRSAGTGAGADRPADLVLVGPETIRAALTTAGITPHRGPTDGAYENAMHNYKNKLYAASVPSLSQVLRLYPGHALAKQALDDANRKKGTAEDLGEQFLPNASGSRAGRPDLVRTAGPVALGAAAVLALVLVILLLARRKQRLAPAGAGPASAPDGAAPGVDSTPPGGTVPPAVPAFQAPSHGDPVPPAPPVRPDQHPPSRYDEVQRQETVVRSRMRFHPTPASPVLPPGPAPGTAADRERDAVDGPGGTPELSTACTRCGTYVPLSEDYCPTCGRRPR